MKILVIDDQTMVLLALQKGLLSLGYEVKTLSDSSKVNEVYPIYNPDLVIVDINMPTLSGQDVIKYIREEQNEDTPIIVLTGNTDDDLITEVFDLGVQDFMKKPLSFSEVQARVKRLIGAGDSKNNETINATIIQKRCVGVVIPCFNEERRLASEVFIKYVEQHSGYRFCFVNDGSSDNTLAKLQTLQKGREDYITIVNLEENKGKAEAVRRGLQHLTSFTDLDYFGFLDADLSTDLKDFDSLVNIIESSDFKIVIGSRIERMGASILKRSARSFIGRVINYFICKILDMNFNDTQCGAKIMTREMVYATFKDSFISKWCFDVEIFLRMKNTFGINAVDMVCEKPLNRWVHKDGSKISYKDSIKIILQLIKIARFYNKKTTITEKNKSIPFFSIGSESIL